MFQTTVTVTGNIVTDFKRGHTLKGDDWVRFRMAANERRYDRASESWTNGDTLYISVTCWRKLAYGVGYALAKGDPVIVTGRLYTNTWEAAEGQSRQDIQLEAHNVGIDLSRCNARIDRAHKEEGGTELVRSIAATPMDTGDDADDGDDVADDARGPAPRELVGAR